MTSSVGLLIWTGYRNGETKNIIVKFANGEVSFSLLIGSLAACLVTFGFTLRTKQATAVPRAVMNGMKTTFPAVWILLFAWMQSELTGLLKTAEYLGGIIEQTNLSSSWLPFLLFILTGIMTSQQDELGDVCHHASHFRSDWSCHWSRHYTIIRGCPIRFTLWRSLLPEF